MSGKPEIIAQAAENWRGEEKLRRKILRLAEVPERDFRFVGDDGFRTSLEKSDLATIHQHQALSVIAIDVVAVKAEKLRKDPILDVIQNPSKHQISRHSLSLLDKADFLENRIKSIFGQYWLPASAFGKQYAIECLRALFDDYLTQACCWEREYEPNCQYQLLYTERFKDKLSLVIPDRIIRTPESLVNITGLHERFEVEVLNVLREWVHSALHRVVKGPTWNICFTSPSPMGVMINIGPDFRVLDWESRMESGEWHM